MRLIYELSRNELYSDRKLQLENSLLSVSALLRKLLPQALDADTFAISDTRPSDTEFSNHCIQVLQTHTDEPSVARRWISPSTARTVAVIDRTASVEEAAKALVNARFSFGGKSPYAPDVILVNEWVERKFLNAVVLCSSRYPAERNGHVEEKPSSKSRGGAINDFVEDAKKEGCVRVVISGTNGTIVDVKNRYTLAKAKFSRINVTDMHAETHRCSKRR